MSKDFDQTEAAPRKFKLGPLGSLNQVTKGLAKTIRAMADGTSIAYDLYLPSGAMPAGGWPGVVVLHGLGGSKDSMAPIAQVFVSHGYAALAYSARGHGTSTGNVELAGPNEISDERAMVSFFTGLPQVSDTKVAAWGISYGGGQT